MPADDIARDPAFEAMCDEVTRLAREDAEADRNPRLLTGDMGALQDIYDDQFALRLVELAAAKEIN